MCEPRCMLSKPCFSSRLAIVVFHESFCYGIGTEALPSASYRGSEPKLATPEKTPKERNNILPETHLFWHKHIKPNQAAMSNFYRVKSQKFEYCTLFYLSCDSSADTPRWWAGAKKDQTQHSKKINSGTRLEMIVGTKPRPNDLKR